MKDFDLMAGASLSLRGIHVDSIAKYLPICREFIVKEGRGEREDQHAWSNSKGFDVRVN